MTKYIIISVITLLFGIKKHTSDHLKINNKPVNIINLSPPSLKVYHSVNKYSKKYSIPRMYSFRMLKQETNYNGPFDFRYNPAQTSSANCEGPGQLNIRTARWILKNNSLTRTQIRHNIELNVHGSIKFAHWIYNNLTKNWTNVWYYYNTGKLNGINKYSLAISKNKK